MKKSLSISTLLLLSLLVSSNPIKSIEKKTKYGFNLGINQSLLQFHESFPEIYRINNELGFQTGIFVETQLSNNFRITPIAELTFNQSTVETLTPQSSYAYFKTTADIALHFAYTIGNGKIAPYISVGPRFQLPIQKKASSSIDYPNNSNFAIDFSIGLNQAFQFFIFAPEIRYSLGLSNLSNPPSTPLLNYHKLSLVFNFK